LSIYTFCTVYFSHPALLRFHGSDSSHHDGDNARHYPQPPPFLERTIERGNERPCAQQCQAYDNRRQPQKRKNSDRRAFHLDSTDFNYFISTTTLKKL
jgi:hypothetical protein